MQPKLVHRPVAVRLSTMAISHVAQHVVDGFTSPEGRQEVCGVLIGWMSDDAERRLTIEDAQAVVSECATDTSQVLLETAVPEFERLIRHHGPGSGAGMPIVGYYRSHMRTELNLDGSDVSTLRSCFPGSVSFCLLIKPAAHKTLVGALFYYQDGSVHRHPATIHLPNPTVKGPDETVQPRNHAEIQRPESLETAVAGVGEHPPLAPRSHLETSVEPGPARGLSWGGWPAIIVAVILAAVGTYLFLELTGRSSGPSVNVARKTESGEAASPVGLRVARDGSDLRVSWRRDSPAVTGARAAVLTIRDGEQRQDILLDAAQLMSGSVLYTPVSDHVQFGLELLAASAAQSTNETVLAISGRKSPDVSQQRTTAPPPQIQPERTRVATPSSQSGRILSQSAVQPSVNASVSRTQSEAQTPPAPPKSAPRQFTPPATEDKVRVVMVEPPPGQIPPATAGAPPRFQATPDAPPPQATPPQAPATKPQPVQEPPRQVLQTRTDPPPPPVVPTTGQHLIPPRPTTQVAPSLTREVRSMIWNDVVVDVRVKVDPTGKVISVEPMRMAGPMRPFLERASADAARQWRFEPARLGDEKVEGEALVQFRFKATTTKQQE